MNLDIKNSYVIPSLVIGICFVLGVTIGASAFYKAKMLNSTLSVTGSAEKTITSDTVKWSSNFSRSVGVEELKTSTQLMQSDLKSIVNYFHAHGITDQNITIKPVSLTASCAGQNYYGDLKGGCGSNMLVGYTLSQEILVESDAVEKITQTAQSAGVDLVEQGLIFSSDGLEYYYSKLADLKLDLLSEATRNATDRAQRIATTSGTRLGKIQSAGMGVFQVTSVNSTDISDYGTYDTSSIEKKVTAVVRTSYLLK